jgi:very-short-patch-repair endonuclease
LEFEQSAVLATAQVERLIGRAKLRGHIRAGRWRRLCRGVVLMGNGRLDHRQRLWVAVLTAGPDALLAGTTAAAEGGVQGLRSEPLQVIVPAVREVTARLPGLPPDMPAVRIYRTSVLPAEHRQIGRPPRTTTARSVTDAAAWARNADEARFVLAAACQQRRVNPAEVLEVLATMSRVRRRKLIRTTIADIEGGAHSLSELDFVTLCRRYHLPPPDLQRQRRDADGRKRYLDAYWTEWQVHVEVDGAHHMDVREWAADMLRQNRIWIAGDRILRFPGWLLRTHPADVAAQVRAALSAAGWPASRP